MIRGTYKQESWWGRREYKDHFWQKERMAEHEEIRREVNEYYSNPGNPGTRLVAVLDTGDYYEVVICYMDVPAELNIETELRAYKEYRFEHRQAEYLEQKRRREGKKPNREFLKYQGFPAWLEAKGAVETAIEEIVGDE